MIAAVIGQKAISGCAVIRHEDDNAVIQHITVLQGLHDLADALVQYRNHGCKW